METTTARTTFSISYYCRKSKENKAGLAPLELCICINQQRLFVNLPVKFSSKEFNKKRKPIEIENILTQYRVKINALICSLMADGIAITATNLREYLKTGGEKSYTVSTLISKFLGDLKKKVTGDNYKKYIIICDYLMEQLGDKELTTININDANNIYNNLKSQYLLSTASGKMTKIKCVFQYAVDCGMLKLNPCNQIKITKGIATISFLSTTDMDKIKSLDLDDYDRLNKVRDLLLFQCSTGMAYADLVNFDSSLIKEMNGVHVYCNNRQKTGIEFTSVIMQDGMDVLKKYDGVLPLISNQKYNSYLKEIQKLAGIHTTITTHLCRKTYAHNMLNNGVRIETVARLLGHSNSNITQKIYCRKTTETIANEVAQIIKVA